MDKKDIIKKITEEVIKKLEKDLAGEEYQASKKLTAKENQDSYCNLVIIPEFFSDLKRPLEIIKKEDSSNQLLFAVKDPVENIDPDLPGKTINISSKSGKNILARKIEELKKIYCISPLIKTVRAVTNLDDAGFIEWLIIRGLLTETEVKMLVDYNFSSSADNALDGIIGNLFEEAEQMGIIIESTHEEKVKKDEEKANRGTDKKLITKKDIDQLWERGQKRLDVSDSVITPLALDRARELKLKVNY